jgi:hypothetical protein
MIVFGGRLAAPMKGADIVASAFAEVRARRTDVRLVLLASREDARQFARFHENVVALGWIIDAADVQAIIAAADVLVMPSRYEPFGLLCAEAMAVGVPVVASPVGGLRSMVRHGANGFLLSSDQNIWPRELADYVLRILGQADVRARLRTTARHDAVRWFSPQRVATRIEELHELVVSSPKSAATIAPAELCEEDGERYLALVDSLLGSTTRNIGARVLEAFPETSLSRCPACTRGKLAREGLALQNAARSRQNLEATLESVCPLGLLQRTLT